MNPSKGQMWILKENLLQKRHRIQEEKMFMSDISGIKFLLNSTSMPFVQYLGAKILKNTRILFSKPNLQTLHYQVQVISFSMTTDILEMSCHQTCWWIMRSLQNLPCLQWELLLLYLKITINFFSPVMKCLEPELSLVVAAFKWGYLHLKRMQGEFSKTTSPSH